MTITESADVTRALPPTAMVLRAPAAVVAIAFAAPLLATVFAPVAFALLRSLFAAVLVVLLLGPLLLLPNLVYFALPLVGSSSQGVHFISDVPW